jgi:hypothetical protein
VTNFSKIALAPADTTNDMLSSLVAEQNQGWTGVSQPLNEQQKTLHALVNCIYDAMWEEGKDE